MTRDITDRSTPHLPGVHPSPNIQDHPDIYGVENRSTYPHRLIEESMSRVAPWADKTVLDLGSGTGFHVPRFHERASRVFAVEPHGPPWALRTSARWTGSPPSA